MPDNVTSLRTGRGSLLASIDLYRMPDGTIRSELRHMATDQIESKDTIPGRLFTVSTWMLDGAIDIMRQALPFDEEHRASIEDADPAPTPPGDARPDEPYQD